MLCYQHHLHHRQVSQHWCGCNGDTPAESVLVLLCTAPAVKHPLWPMATKQHKYKHASANLT